VHGFLEMTRQRETFTRAVSWIGALHPGAQASTAPPDRTRLSAAS